jgi:hypothetical protein
MNNKLNDNELVIYLDRESLIDSLKKLEENEKYLILGSNLFSIENIVSCFEIINDNSPTLFDEPRYCYFRFSYNDDIVKQMINVKVLFEGESVYDFLKTSTYMDENQLENLVKKVYELAEEDTNLKSLDGILYNEALIFITSAINNNECKNVKDDFESKYEIFKEKQLEINLNKKSLVKDLFEKIIQIKVK